MVSFYCDSVAISTTDAEGDNKELLVEERAFLRAKTNETNFDVFTKKVWFTITAVGAIILLYLGKIIFFQGLDGLISFLQLLN